MSLQLILKNSSVEDRHPTASQLTNGEIALNYNEAGAFLSCRDTNGDIQHIGGVKIDDATPDSPSKQALWFQPSTSKLFIYDGTGWLVVASGGSSGPGSGTVDQILAGNGINSSPSTGLGTITLDADLNFNRGLEFDAGQIGIAIGAGLEFDGNGKLANAAGAVQYRGTLDLTSSDPKPTTPAQGDTWLNTASGTSNAVWNPDIATGTTVGVGDQVIYNGTIWTFVAQSVSPAGRTDLGLGVVDATSVEVTSSTGSDVQLPAATGTTAGVLTAADKLIIDEGASTWERDGSTLQPVDDTYGVKIGGTLPASPNIELHADGSSQLQGDMKIGGTLPASPNITLAAAGTATAVDVVVTNVKRAMALATDSTGKIIPAAAPFTWDANDDNYARVPVADRDISVQARMRRCLVTDGGAVTYLDADDSTKLAGDWLRLCETTELATAYTGTHGAEVQNTLLRALAPAWAAGTFTKGALVTNGGSVWECIAATTTATPAAGAAAATLDGTAGQVMVEIPTFSVYHRGDVVGKHCRHQWAVSLGAAQGGGYVTHPAFIKPDGSIRKAIYIGAYQGTGTNGNGSASGVNNTTNMTRAACRTACAGRGTGWHQLGYAEHNAVQLLLLTEYQDLNSQKVLGNGSDAGGTYVVNTGLSNARGNRSENVHTPAGANGDYVSYRGVENIYGRAWQWTDGININERAAYVCTDPSKWADNTAADYDVAGVVPAGSGSYIRDVFSTGTYLLPRSVDGGSGTTYVGDALWTSSGWRVAFVGGGADFGTRVGALCVYLYNASSDRNANLGGRLSYAA